MKLQLALDFPSLDSSLRLLEQVRELFDIVEVGTPLVLAVGMRAVSALKHASHGLTILADLKIMDAGDLEARIALEAGADIVTVLALAHAETIRGVVEAAHRAGKEAMADLIGVADPSAHLELLQRSGVDLVCCHTAFDRQSSGESPTASLAAVRRAAPNMKIAVAGGIDPVRIRELLPFAPEIVIVGGYVARASDPRAAAQALREAAAGALGPA